MTRPRAVHTGSRQRRAGTKGRREVDARSRPRAAPPAGKSLAGADRPGAAARMGAVRRRSDLGTAGATVKLTTVGAPTPQVSETTVKRADAPRLLEYNWGGNDIRWELEPLGSGTRLTLWHNIDRRFISMGAAGLAHLLRRARSAPRGSADRTHRRRRGHEVRRLAAIERRVRKAVRRREPGWPPNAPNR